MRILFLIIVALHGLLHVLGFIKGFHLFEIKGFTLPISKPLGIAWLTATILFITFGILYFYNSRFAWAIGISAVIISQILIFLCWKDAKYGSIPNFIILAVSLISFGYYNFQKLIYEETQLLLQNVKVENKILKESDLFILPEPVKKWMFNSGAIGKPFINIGKVTQIVKMKMKPGQDDWLTASATQFTTIETPAFIWTADVKMNSMLNFQGRDKFQDGKGEMLIKMNSLINVVNERGEKLDEGTLQRFLGEMVWFPTMALSPYISWELIDDNTAKASMSYKGNVGSGTFYFNSKGEVVKFSAMRYKGNDAEAKRYEWIMNILDYKTFEGIKVPAKMTSTWKLEEEDWTWLEMEVTGLNFNENLEK